MGVRNRLRRWKGEEGSAALEMAISTMLYMVIVLGILDLTRMIYAYNFVSFAAREASRYASVRGTANPATSATVKTFVRSEAVAAINQNNVNVTTTWSPNHTAGSRVTVNVSYTYSSLFSFVLAHPVTFQSSSTMVIAQ
jgi:Flp pilus assembly protein TadG